MLEEKTCIMCGSTYEPRKKDQLFCCKDCMNASRRVGARTTAYFTRARCAMCGDAFLKPRTAPQVKVCSEECQKELRIRTKKSMVEHFAPMPTDAQVNPPQNASAKNEHENNPKGLIERLKKEFLALPNKQKAEFLGFFVPVFGESELRDLTISFAARYPEHILEDIGVGDTIFHPFEGMLKVVGATPGIITVAMASGDIPFDRNGIVPGKEQWGRMIFRDLEGDYIPYIMEMSNKKAANNAVAT